MTTYRQRFGLRHDLLPRAACGKTCFDGDDAFVRLRRVFSWLAAEPGLGLLTGEPGAGKTTAMRHLCSELPRPEHRIVYLCDTRLTPAAVYRNLAAALGLDPPLRRDALWRQLKAALVDLVERESIVPVVVLDEAQHLRDDFFHDLAGFLNHAFDRADLMTLWLVGLPSLRARLELRVHAALRTRIVAPTTLGPRSKANLLAMIDHSLKSAGARPTLLADGVREIVYRLSRGLPRLASHLLRAALIIADEREQTCLDEQAVLDAAVHLELPVSPPPAHAASGPAKTRSQRGTKVRSQREP